MLDTSPGTLRDLQNALLDLRTRGLGRAKSAAIDRLSEGLSEALRLGFTRQEIWNALREAGYEGSYRYFGTKLHRLGITRSRVATQPSTRQVKAETSSVALGHLPTVLEQMSEEPHDATSDSISPADDVEVQRRRLREARERGEIYRQPQPPLRKKFQFNPEH